MGFVIAALATVLIALVNFRTAQVRAHAVEAMDETTATFRPPQPVLVLAKGRRDRPARLPADGDDTYLQPYNLSLTAMQRNMARLKGTTDDSASSAAWCCRSTTCATKAARARRDH